MFLTLEVALHVLRRSTASYDNQHLLDIVTQIEEGVTMQKNTASAVLKHGLIEMYGQGLYTSKFRTREMLEQHCVVESKCVLLRVEVDRDSKLVLTV